jgi:hypothetical protein
MRANVLFPCIMSTLRVLIILWRACSRQYGMCWQPLLWQRINTQQWKQPAFSVVWPQPARNSRGNCCSLYGLFPRQQWADATGSVFFVVRSPAITRMISCCEWVSYVDSSSYERVFGPSSSLPRRVAELQAIGSCDIGREATSEDTVWRLGKWTVVSYKAYTL